MSNIKINMTVFEVFLCILLLYIPSSSNGQINKQFEIVLENPLENFPLKNLEIDLETKNIYASGKNILYRLSVEEDISVITKQTGPDAHCLPLSHEELKEYCGDDYNTVMVVTTDSLITCSTLKGGLCMRRNKESLNIIKTSTSSNVRLVSNDKVSAVGIFLNISDKSSPGNYENIVLFAKQYTTLPLAAASLDKTAIFSVLPDLSAVNIGSSKFGRIFDLILKPPISVIMDYRVAIENENFVFLLVNQNSQSKLVKICKSIDSKDPKNVYEDIPLSCYAEGTKLTLFKHGAFIIVSGKRYLVGLFSSSNPTLSAMCIFEENEIYQAFLEARIHRYGCPLKSDLPAEDVIFDADTRGNNTKCVPSREPLEGVYDAFHTGDYCNSVTNQLPQFGIIVGLLPLEGNALYSTKSHRFTVIGSSIINNLTILFIGTDIGNVIQLFYDTEKNKTSLLPELKCDSSEIRAVGRLDEETYIMSQNKIVKLLQTQNCGQYSENCQQCMDVQDVHCGWCVSKGSCSTYSECTSTYWLLSIKNECLSLDLSIDLSRHAYKMERKLLTMMTPLNYFENMTCSLDGLNVTSSFNAGKIYCRINSTIRTYIF